MPTYRFGDDRGLVIASNEAVSSLTWATAADWDAGSGTPVHEDVANTDYTDDTVVRMGPSVASPPVGSGNTVALYTHHEDAGNTLYDQSGNGNDGTINGATLGQTGVVDTSAAKYDGSGDYTNCGEIGFEGLGEFSIIAFVAPDSTSGPHDIINNGGSTANDTFFLGLKDGNVQSDINSGSVALSGGSPTTGSYQTIALTHSASNSRSTLYLDAASVASGGSVSSVNSTSETFKIGGRDDTRYYDGRAAYTFVYSTELSASDIQTLHDAVFGTQTLTTAYKSAGFAASTLETDTTIGSSESVDVTVEQDVGSDGTVDNSQTVSLSGGFGETNPLSGFSASSGQYRVVVDLSNSDPTKSPTVKSVTLT